MLNMYAQVMEKQPGNEPTMLNMYAHVMNQQC
jgi:hypothetical protein